ncbi:MAG: hypothetical protein FWH03_06020 [Firmicutes bacterium]|nr:hypothetical protein [Bacillota bacterium]
MEEKIEHYNNIYAYKAVSNLFVLCVSFGGIFLLFVCIFFIAVAFTEHILYIIGAVPTGLIGLFLFGLYIKRNNDVILTQKKEFLYLFPDTKKQIVLPLKDIISIEKSKFGLWVLGNANAGKLIITSTSNCYALRICDFDKIHMLLNENLAQFTAQQTQ